MSWSPRVTVAAVIRREDRFLVVEECPLGPAVLNQPAGHLEEGESLIEAVIREVREETTREFTPDGVVGIYRLHLPERDRTYLRFCFAGRVGEPVPGYARDTDITDNHWLTRAEIAQGDLPVRSPLVLAAIDDSLSRPAWPLDLLRELGHEPG